LLIALLVWIGALGVAGLLVYARDFGIAAAWDFFLSNLAAEAVGIFFTVSILNKILARREEKRWLPARLPLYYRWFNAIDALISTLTPPRTSPASATMYQFGESSIAVSRLKDFEDELDAMDTEAFIETASALMRNRPQFLYEKRQELDNLREQSVGVLSTDPEFVRLANDLNVRLALAIDELSEQVDTATANELDEEVIWLGAHSFEFVARSAYTLWEWLANKATTERDVTAWMSRWFEDREKTRGGHSGPPE
jgi:hypothetical protein